MDTRKAEIIASLDEQASDRFFKRRSARRFTLHDFEDESLLLVHGLLTTLDETEIDALVSFIRSFNHHHKENN